jgi:salicylate hydroxylase
LTAALALALDGHSVTVFEKAEGFDDIGAGIQLSPNAMNVLTQLGVAEAIAARAFAPQSIRLIDGLRGGVLSELPLAATMQARHGAPYLVAHRADLHAVLLAACGATAGVTMRQGRVFESAGGEAFDVVVAADGINSALRREIDPTAKPVALGQTAWRTAIDARDAARLVDTAGVSVFMGPGAHAVAYRMGARDAVNIVAVCDAAVSAPKDAFKGWSRGFAALFDLAAGWTPWRLREVRAAQWNAGRMVMIGDAAHAMAPHAAQGGAMAIEDASLLAAALARPANRDGIAASLKEFSALRANRVERVRRLGEQNRRIYQMGGIMAFGRAIVTPLMPPARLINRLDWLYGGP